MSKEINVTGRIPLSVRRQVGKGKKTRTRRTLKHKKIKKIKTPSNQRAISQNPTNTIVRKQGSSHNLGKTHESKGLKGIIQTGQGRTKNKTVKKVRFNLESQGVQTGKFRNAHRVKMKTAKRSRSSIHRSKNRTSKNQRFKIRFSDGEDSEQNQLTQTGGDLVSRLKEFKKETSGIIIKRI